MTIHRIALAVVASMLAANATHAESISPIEGKSIHLGEISGVAYYTVDQNDFRVVVTLAQGEISTPVRVAGTLNPGQSLVFSIPNGVGAPLSAVEIRREGDKVLVERSASVN